MIFACVPGGSFCDNFVAAYMVATLQRPTCSSNCFDLAAKREQNSKTETLRLVLVCLLHHLNDRQGNQA